jgi:hypothetical protein
MSRVSMRVFGLSAVVFSTAMLGAQTAVPHQAGTVKAVTADSVTLTTAAGQDVVVSVPAAAKVLVVPPESKDLKSATAGALSDVAVGDKVLVTGTPGDTTALTATRVILMKSSAIAQAHAAEDAAWAAGGGGIVKSVDAAAGTIVVSQGMKLLTVVTTPSTIIRRYSGDSVKFADAQASTLSAAHPGDQLRVRGTKSTDGSSITADEIVTGTFHNYSGLIASIDPAAETITLKDLATKKTVTVAVTPNSDVRRIPPMMAQGISARMKGGAAAASSEDAARAGRAGADLSQMLSRLPAETLGGLKAGDSVMIVATSGADGAKSTAVTLLVGVEAILTAPSGQATTLSPWSLGSSDAGGAQ